jgi:hypothetical protein
VVSCTLFMVRVCDTMSYKWVTEFQRNMLPCIFNHEDEVQYSSETLYALITCHYNPGDHNVNKFSYKCCTDSHVLVNTGCKETVTWCMSTYFYIYFNGGQPHHMLLKNRVKFVQVGTVLCDQSWQNLL